MRVAYVRVDLGDPEDKEPPVFVVSPVPFLYREGELVMSAGVKMYGAKSYPALCTTLKREFHIPAVMLPPAKYFKPTRTEKEEEEWHIHRTVPEGAGEPEWRTNARQALIGAVDEASWSLWVNGRLMVNGKHCCSIEELRQELETIAEKAGGRKRIKGEAYQPDYDVLVKEALERDSHLLHYSGLPKTHKRAK